MAIKSVTVETAAKYELMSDDSLYDLLGSTVHLPEIATISHRALTIDDAGRPNGARELGKRIYSRWSRTLHDFLCAPSTEDKDLTDKVWAALAKQGGAVAALSAVLVSAFGLAPATAAIVAALVMKLVVTPAGNEVCKFWSEKLEAAQ